MTRVKRVASLCAAVGMMILTGLGVSSVQAQSSLDPLGMTDAFNDVAGGYLGSKDLPNIEIDSWIEGDGTDGAVVVALVPKNGALLVRDPGTTFTVAGADSVAWNVEMPAEMRDSAGGYWTTPQFFRVPFSGPAPSLVEAQLEYAYCIKDYQCIFGFEDLTILK